MNNTLNAFKKIGEGFRELFSAVKEDMAPAKPEVKANNDEQYEASFHKATDTLSKLLSLEPKYQKNIQGYTASENDLKNRKFSTENYAILSSQDKDYNPNFSKFDFQVVDKEKNVILQRTTIYDIHHHDTEVTFQVAPGAEKKIDDIITMVEQDIRDSMKFTATENIRKMQERIRESEPSNTFKPA